MVEDLKIDGYYIVFNKFYHVVCIVHPYYVVNTDYLQDVLTMAIISNTFSANLLDKGTLGLPFIIGPIEAEKSWPRMKI